MKVNGKVHQKVRHAVGRCQELTWVQGLEVGSRGRYRTNLEGHSDSR